ncbi:Por secretion system C-terminal sorting domain-containing protein [Myroides marinus]|uniref:Por secretion system C-terminal sorting domain-containing protein n=1 Tax=Myroides marinus TaxID=703342 RepID=A0A1H6XHL9_9FLAO|nr:S8 family peptidase [Myroides marinus]SEJ24352.1 Por secretion system C-terminal sorting domain-containing protein [Myroides marinus]
MKKLLLPILVMCCVYGHNAMGQTMATRNAIRSTYDLDKSSKIINSFSIRAQENRQRAYAIAAKDNLPTVGVNARGNYFELDGVDANGFLRYKITLNQGSRVTARAENLRSGVNSGDILEGEGMQVGVIDGLPMLDTHQEFGISATNGASRVTLKEAMPPLESIPMQFLNDGRYHATHVGGTIGSGGFVKKESKGIAPKAKIWSYSWKDDIQKMSYMASEGVLTSNHSYGYAFFDDYGNIKNPEWLKDLGAYDETSQSYDALTMEYEYYLPVFAAGNDGTYQRKTYRNSDKANCDCDMLNGGSIAKNTVVVAAVKDVLSYTGASSVEIAGFSSQGPTNDFRIKPDISAKGFNVFSLAYELPYPITAAPRNDVYGSISGTSMAAPAITGVFILWQEWATKFANEKKMPYKSATIRALMAHTADEAGPNPGPDHKFGWGLINAKAGVDVMLAAKDQRSAYISENILNNGQKYVQEIKVTEPMTKMVVTLAWTDPMAGVSIKNTDEEYMKTNPLLINDLDLVVRKDGEVYFPWKLNKNFNDLKAVRGVNDVDNIEKIEIFDVKPGKYIIEIGHSKSLQGAKPQAYSLITTIGEFDKLRKMKDKEDENDESTDIKLWPNPVVDNLFITVGKKYNGRTVNVRIFDINGRLVSTASEIAEQGAISVNMQGHNANVYIVEVKTFDSSKTTRIAKK